MCRNVQSSSIPFETIAESSPGRHPAPVTAVRSILYGVLSLTLLLPGSLSADFSQTEWSGGESTATATDSLNQTGWTSFASREADLLAANDGTVLAVAGAPESIEHTAEADLAFGETLFTHTTDADFLTGDPTLENVVVTDGSIQLTPGQTTGEYESAVIDLGSHLAFTEVQFAAQTPPGTKITRAGENPQFPTIGVRGSDDGLTFTQYIEYSSGFVPAELFLSRFIQYRVQLDTVNPTVTPSLDEVTFVFRNYPVGSSDLRGIPSITGTPVDVICSAGGSAPCDAQVQLADGFNSGIYISSIIDLERPRELTTLDFDHVTPGDTLATVLVRAGSLPNPNTTAGAAAWTDWQVVPASGDDISGLGMYRYVQYAVELTRPSGGATPVLESVRLNYLGDPVPGSDASLTSSPINSEAADNRLRAIHWTEDLPEGSEVRFRIATAPVAEELADAVFVGPDGTDATYWSSDNAGGAGGCFQPSDVSPVTCTGISAELRDGVGDQWIQYLVTLIVGDDPDPQSPMVSDVFLDYGGGPSAGVIVAPVSGLVTTEAGEGSVFSVVLTESPDEFEPVTIDLKVDKPDEISLAVESVTFTSADWHEPQPVSILGEDDDVNDGDQVVTISPVVTDDSDPAYVGVDIPDVVVTNVDDEILTATVTVADANATEAGPTPGTFTISLNGPAPADTPVAFEFEGTATVGADFFASPQSPAVIPAGQESVTVTITPIDDVDAEGDETVQIRLTGGGTGYVLDTVQTASLIIIDNETSVVPTVSVTRSSTNPNEEFGLNGFFRISRTGPTGTSLAVMYTVGGTATPGADYTALGDSVVIPIRESDIVVPLMVIDDNFPEGDETVILTLSADPSYQISAANSSTTLTIIDDETIPDVAVPGGAAGGGGDDDSGLGATSPWGGLLLLLIYLLSVARRAAVRE